MTLWLISALGLAWIVVGCATLWLAVLQRKVDRRAAKVFAEAMEQSSLLGFGFGAGCIAVGLFLALGPWIS